MRHLLVIGIGTGNPDHVTVEAVRAMNSVDVFLIVDKGEQKSGLVELRAQILARHVTTQHRVVEVADPPRDRDPATGRAYLDAVNGWHEARARLFAAALAEQVGDGQTAAFLVWGDPSLYDSTLRVIEAMRALDVVAFDHRVIAGITSVQALTAAHRIPLNRVGEQIVITPARQLTPEVDNAVVMLDRGFSAADYTGLDVYWGAYLGSPEQVTIAGRLPAVGAEIERTRAQLRDRHGWIMDTYLLRRPTADPAPAEEGGPAGPPPGVS